MAIKLYYTLLHYTILCYAMLYYTILYYTTLHFTIYYTILYFTILYYTILYYTILYYTILYYTTLYFAILCYTIRHYTPYVCFLYKAFRQKLYGPKYAWFVDGYYSPEWYLDTSSHTCSQAEMREAVAGYFTVVWAMMNPEDDQTTVSGYVSSTFLADVNQNEEGMHCFNCY